jgi:hypothetical protein
MDFDGLAYQCLDLGEALLDGSALGQDRLRPRHVQRMVTMEGTIGECLFNRSPVGRARGFQRAPKPQP